MLIGNDLTLVADTHTHTLVCDHAFSTLHENIKAAKAKGFSFLCSTEHGPKLPGAPTALYFYSLPGLPDEIDGVTLLKGAEVNIHDYEGGFDLPDSLLEQLDWVIASMHTPVLSPTTEQAHTEAWLKVAKNPHVDVIGHAGDARFAFDYEAVIPVFAAEGKIVEINSHSFGARPGSTENCTRIARLCAQHRVPIVVSSDAHIHENIGNFSDALAMLRKIDFPKELILNADYDRFLAVAREKTGRRLRG